MGLLAASMENPEVGVSGGVPGGIGGVESGAGLLSGVTMFHGSGPSTHNGGTIIRSHYRF